MSKPTYFTGTCTLIASGLRNSATTSTLAAARDSQVLEQPGEGQPGVDDVLDDDHVPAGDVAVEVLEDPHHPGRGRALAVRRDGHELQLDRRAVPAQRAGEVGHEHDRALEHADEQQPVRRSA